MQNPRSLITALAATAFLACPAWANLIVSDNADSLSLFSDTGTKILDYSTSLVNPQQVVTDNSGHVYVAEYGTPGAYDGNVKMYHIASGTFIRDILPPNLYAPTGVAFNPANPDEIIVIAQYSAGASQLGRWFTSATGASAGANSNLGVPYAGIYYNPTISGGAPEGIYAAAPAGAVQYYNSSTLNWGPYEIPAIPDIGTSAPNGIAGLGTDLFFANNNGDVIKYSGGVQTTIVDNTDGYYGITNDGTNLWVAQYVSGFAGRYDTSGNLNGFFPLTNPVGIAYTTINFNPSSYPIVVNNPSFENGFTGDPNTGWANAEGGTWGSPYIPGSELSPPADGLAAGFGNGGTAYQIISNHTILAGTYTILVDVGQRNDGFYTPFSMAVFSVNGPGGDQGLGGYSLATDPPVGGWSTLTATITINNGDPAIGGNLQLNLNSPGVQTVVDNVRISYAAPSSQIPTLTIQQVSGSQVRLAWPTSALGWMLETSTSLLPGSWTDSTATITVEGEENAVYEPISGKRFYRLYK